MQDSCERDKNGAERSIKESANSDRRISQGPYVQFRYEVDEKTGQKKLIKSVLSDGTESTVERRRAILCKAVGSSDVDRALLVLGSISMGLPQKQCEERFNDVACLLPAFEPKDEAESMLIGQFLALSQAGHHSLRQFHDQSNANQAERFGSLSSKLFAQANASMQTLLKYRSGGQQTMQIVHVHNEGQAILTQNLTHTGVGQGMQKESTIEPHG